MTLPADVYGQFFPRNDRDWVRFDAKKVRFGKLADLYWRQIDPLGSDRQFLDTGYQFHTAILYRDSAQKREALASRAQGFNLTCTRKPPLAAMP